MALAYVITAFRSPGQFARLFRAVYHSEDTFVLHVSPSGPKELHDMAAGLARDYPNVFCLRSRELVWGGWQLVDAQIEAMGVALAKGRAWSHFVNLSGQDFPIKSRDKIVRHFEENARKSFMTWFDPFATDVWSDPQKRIDRYFIHWPWLMHLLRVPILGRRLRVLMGWGWENRMPHIPLIPRPRPSFFRLFAGSNHVVLAREACEYIVKSSPAQRVVKWFRHGSLMDELVLQSTLLNSPLADTVVNANFCHIEFVRHSPNPRILTSEDFEMLSNHSKFWARKFDESVDGKILDRLEQFIGNNSLVES